MGRNAAKSIASTCAPSLRFRATNLASDKSEHFTEALNISPADFSSRRQPRSRGMPIRLHAAHAGRRDREQVAGHALYSRVVHVRNEPYGDGRIGFGAEIEKYHTRK